MSAKPKFDMKSMMDRMVSQQFSKVENLVVDLMGTGQTGLKTKDGIVTISSGGGGAKQEFELTCNPFEMMTMEVPAFAMMTPRENVAIMDIVVNSSNQAVGWVTKINPKSFSILKADGTTTQWNPPKVQMMGMGVGGIKVVKQMFNMAGGVAGAQGSMLPMMMMLGMSEDGDGDDSMMEMLMPMMLMQQMGGQGGQNNMMAQMMPMMMMSKVMKKGF